MRARSVPSASARQASLARVEDRIEAAREVMRQVAARVMAERHRSLIAAGAGRFAHDFIDAYRRADLDWVIDHTDAEVVIVQVPEIPDARTYTATRVWSTRCSTGRASGRTRMTPERIFAPDTEDLIAGRPRGRPHSMDIEVEAEIVFAFHVPDGRVARWDMYLTLDEAPGRAAQSRADRDDDRAAQRHGGERA